MTDRRRKAGSADSSQELQLWGDIQTKLRSLDDAQTKLGESITVLGTLQENYHSLEGKNGFGKGDNSDDEDEDVVDDDKDDEIAALQNSIEAAYDKLRSQTLQEKSLATEALESLGVLIALRTPELPQTDTAKRKKRKLEGTSPAPMSDASVQSSTRASPAPSATRGSARAGNLTINTSGTPSAFDGDRVKPHTAGAAIKVQSSSPAPESPRPHSAPTAPPATARSGTPLASSVALQASKSSTGSHGRDKESSPWINSKEGREKDTSSGPPTGRPLTKKERKEILAAQLPLKEGRPVAFRPPGKAQSKGAKLEGGSTDWIQARVVRCIQGDKNRYEVQDVDDADSADGKPGACYNTTLKAILVLPDPRDKSTYPPQYYPVGSDVIALYPETTSFYKARVVGLPGNGKKQNYKLIFEDDNDEIKAVSVDYVVDLP